jgi:tetratricopeptide (TPR) repeat protein
MPQPDWGRIGLMRRIADTPYSGRSANQQGDQEHHYRRRADTVQVIDLWTANRLTVLTGPVASGKSSLLRAGVCPTMREYDPDMLPVGSVSSGITFPFAAVPKCNPYAYALLSTWVPSEVPTRLAGLTVTEFVRQRARGRHGILFAAIDQFEDIAIEASTGQRRAWRRQFLDDLAQAAEATTSLHLLLVVRADSLDAISPSLGIGARHVVGPLDVTSAVEAVTRPPASAGRAVTAEAARHLIEDLRTSRIASAQSERYVRADRVEPVLLQVACDQLWRDLPGDRAEISDWDIREYSDVDAALGAFCAQVIGEVAAEYGFKAQQLHSLLVKAFITDSGARGVAHEGQAATAGMPNAVARALVDRHLLSSEQRSSTRWYQLLSDRLIDPLLHASLTHVYSKRPPTADGYLRTALRQFALDEADLASAFAVRALASKPTMRVAGEARVLLGNVAYEQGDNDAALPHYQEAASLLEAAGDPGAALHCLAAVGQTLLALGRIREAVAEFRAAVGRAPNDQVLQTQLALALWQQGEGETAIAILNGVLGVDGASAEALRARGEILADLGDARNAIYDLERPSIRDLPSAQAARGLALAELGDHSAAMRVISDAVETAPRNGTVLFFAARASALAGDKAASWELAQRAVDATDPPLSPSHRKLAEELAVHT